MYNYNPQDWKLAFVEKYLRDQPETAVLVAKPGSGIAYASLNVWERLVQEYGFKNLVIIAPSPALKTHWTNLTMQLPVAETTSVKLIIENPLKIFKNEDLSNQVQMLLNSPDTFFIVDEAHRFTRDTRLKSFLTNNSGNISSSKILFLTGMDKDVYESMVDKGLWKSEYIYDDLLLNEFLIKSEIIKFSPSYGILERVLSQGLKIDNLSWREFEKLIAQLLESEGYEVELMKGTRDGGVDVVAIKKDAISGLYKTVWQAKKYTKNKVGLNVIRELADSVLELKASKGIIVTTTFLTADALNRVQRDMYTLSKVDREDLNNWINRIIYR